MLTNIIKPSEYDVEAKFFKIENIRITNAGKIVFSAMGYPTRKAANNQMRAIYQEEFKITIDEWADKAKANQLVKALEAYVQTQTGYIDSVAE